MPATSSRSSSCSLDRRRCRCWSAHHVSGRPGPATDVLAELSWPGGPNALTGVQLLSQVDMVSPTAGQPCSHAPPHPLAKKFEGIRDVNVSVSLMEDFMRYVLMPATAVPASTSVSFVRTFPSQWALTVGVLRVQAVRGQHAAEHRDDRAAGRLPVGRRLSLQHQHPHHPQAEGGDRPGGNAEGGGDLGHLL